MSNFLFLLQHSTVYTGNFFELSSFVEHNSNIFMRARSQRLIGPRLRGSCCPKPPKQTQKCPKMLIDKY